MGREENIQVFEDTKQKCQSDVRLRQAIVQANAVQKLILGSDIETWKPACRYMRPAQVIVSRKRTLEAASAYIGKKVCVLNFASATNPGGRSDKRLLRAGGGDLPLFVLVFQPA